MVLDVKKKPLQRDEKVYTSKNYLKISSLYAFVYDDHSAPEQAT
jgi:hypothetical protein